MLIPPTAALALVLGTAGALAQEAQGAAALAQEAAEAPDALKIYFDTGRASIRPDQAATLDAAARLFRDGNPIVMIVSGLADTVGRAESNLGLSVRRALAVSDGLVARGIPAARLQVLGRGNSELAVDTGDGVSEPENRVAEITWR